MTKIQKNIYKKYIRATGQKYIKDTSKLQEEPKYVCNIYQIYNNIYSA